jgi:polar amino acid transport system permease protein
VHFNPASLLQGQYGRLILHGLVLTVELTVCAWLLAMMLAIVLAVIRLTDRPLPRRMVMTYVAYHRNVPTLVQLMVWYFGVPALVSEQTQIWLAQYNSEFLLALIALGMCQAAYFSEDIRTGLRALGPGQGEAARSLGMTYLGAMRHVILPQALRHAAPALANNSILLFKNTSLAMAIGLPELTYAIRDVDSESFRTFECYMIASVLYLSGSLLLMALGGWIGRRYRIGGASVIGGARLTV